MPYWRWPKPLQPAPTPAKRNGPCPSDCLETGPWIISDSKEYWRRDERDLHDEFNVHAQEYINRLVKKAWDDAWKNFECKGDGCVKRPCNPPSDKQPLWVRIDSSEERVPDTKGKVEKVWKLEIELYRKLECIKDTKQPDDEKVEVPKVEDGQLE